MRILLLEGDEQTATVVCNALAGERYILDRAKNCESARQLVAEGDYNLLIVDTCVLAADKLAFYQTLRTKVDLMPVLPIAPPEIEGNIEGLLDDLAIEPVKLTDLASRLSILMQLERQKRDCAEAQLRDRQQQLRLILARAWERAKPNFLDQVIAIETAIQALDKLTQKQAEQQAHKLAGSLGTYGLYRGSELAKKIETILELDLSTVSQQTPELEKLVLHLRELILQTTAENLQSIKNSEAATDRVALK
jgi:DNA-binding response OmpR family regulator